MEFVAIFSDPKISGESAHQPHCRLATFRITRLKKLLTAVMKTREDQPTELHEGDIYFLSDGFKSGEHVRTRTHMHMHTHIHACMHACMHTCMHMSKSMSASSVKLRASIV